MRQEFWSEVKLVISVRFFTREIDPRSLAVANVFLKRSGGAPFDLVIKFLLLGHRLVAKFTRWCDVSFAIRESEISVSSLNRLPGL